MEQPQRNEKKAAISGQADSSSRMRLIALAGWIALLGNLLLAVIKVVAGIAAESLAVLGDGLDSATDVSIACMTLIVSRIIQQPSDKEHPWGHGRAETTATMVVAFIIFYAGMQLCFSSGKHVINLLATNSLSNNPAQEHGLSGGLALTATAISIAGKLLLAWSQLHLGKKSGSMMVLANARNMATDSIISISVLVGLAATQLLKLPVIDPVVAFLVGLWVLKNAVSLFMEMNLELMDGNQDKELYASGRLHPAGTSTWTWKWIPTSASTMLTKSLYRWNRLSGRPFPMCTTSWCTWSRRVTAATIQKNSTAFPNQTLKL